MCSTCGTVNCTQLGGSSFQVWMKSEPKHATKMYNVGLVLYKMVLTFESVDEILKCGHSNESY